jgi:small subunit ribosomal protein S5
VSDILTKSLGSTNPHNMVRAAMDGLTQLTTVDQIARERGLEPAQVGYRPRVMTRRTETLAAAAVEAV